MILESNYVLVLQLIDSNLLREDSELNRKGPSKHEDCIGPFKHGTALTRLWK